jgi:hypothetical protein
MIDKQDEIAQQQRLLATYRANLEHLLNQAAEYGGEDSTPVHIINQLHDQRAAIQQCKSALRAYGVEVVDEPGEQLSETASGQVEQPSAATRRGKWIIAESRYARWATIAGAVVGVMSLLLNVVLGLSNLRLERDKAQIERDKAEIGRKIDEVELENKRLDNLIKKSAASVDLEVRYFVVSGLGIFDIERVDPGDAANRPAIVQNQVLDELKGWFDAWGTGESLVVDDNGVQRSHGVVLLRVFNRGKQDAQRIVLTVRWKDFSQQGELADNLWELQTDGWQETKVQLADLQVGQSVIVPLTHVLGTNTYFGRVTTPIRLDWFNPTLQTQESAPVAGMAPEDQWISKGLNISVGQ